jgi:tetratricopeptide (TPR) repeat protein
LLGEFAYKREDYKQAAGHYLEGLRLADAQIVPPEDSVELRQLYDPLIEALIRKQPQALMALCENIQTLLMQADWKKRLGQARSQLSELGAGAAIRPVVEILTENHSGELMDAIAQIKAYRSQGLLHSAMDRAYCTIDLAPTYLPLHRLIGDLMVDLGNIPAALAKYQTVAKSYSSRGETQQAIGMYRSMLELAPTDLQVRNRLIAQLIAANQTESAVQEYMHLAEIYYRQADFNTSRRIYTDGLRLAHQAHVDRSLHGKILHRMADIDMQSLDWRQAMRVFEQIRTLQPDDKKARYRLVELNLRLNQEKQALSEMDQYLDHLLETKQEESAVAFMQTFASENPQLVSIRRRLADLYRHLGRKEEAVAQLDAIGELLLEGGDRAGAIQIMDTLLGLEPANRDAYELLLKELRGGAFSER